MENVVKNALMDHFLLKRYMGKVYSEQYTEHIVLCIVYSIQ